MNWSDKFPSKKAEPFQFAPDWFIEAHRQGKNREELIALVREFCAEAEKYEAESEGKPAPTAPPDDMWVMLMFKAYEDSLNDTNTA